MKLVIILFISYAPAFVNICSGQENKLFDTKTISLKDNSYLKLKGELSTQNSVFYEDEDYLVTKICHGEWGGAVRFKNKKTGITYLAASTCPVAITKMNGKYIVTSSLSHMSGISEVIEISNPDSLEILNPPAIKKEKTVVYVGEVESKATKGTINLLTSYGTLVLTSFQYQDSLYHIITDLRRTYLAKIKDKKFAIMDTISDHCIWPSKTVVYKNKNGYPIIFFDQRDPKFKGYLEIAGNQLRLRTSD